MAENKHKRKTVTDRFVSFNRNDRGHVSADLYDRSIYSDDATVVELELGDFKVTGASKRAPGDPRSPEVGYSLAYARALRKLADQIDAEYADLTAPAVAPKSDVADVPKDVQSAVEYVTAFIDALCHGSA